MNNNLTFLEWVIAFLCGIIVVWVSSLAINNERDLQNELSLMTRCKVIDFEINNGATGVRVSNLLIEKQNLILQGDCK